MCIYHQLGSPNVVLSKQTFASTKVYFVEILPSWCTVFHHDTNNPPLCEEEDKIRQKIELHLIKH